MNMEMFVKWFLYGAGAVHGLFMVLELFPWSFPILLKIVSKKLPALTQETEKEKKWTDAQQSLVATIVHNAGIYNGILAGGLFWAAWAGAPARDVAAVLLVGATVAGIFGTVTLKSPATGFQALVGAAGCFVLWRC
jgi:putative membrane protein